MRTPSGIRRSPTLLIAVNTILAGALTATPGGRGGHGATFSAAPGFLPTPSAHVLSLYASLANGHLVDHAIVNNPERALPAGGQLSALQALSALDADGNVVLIVTNRDRETDVTTRVVTEGYRVATLARVRVVTGSGVLANNSPENPDAVSIEEHLADAGPDGFAYTFPAHSVTAITFSPASR